MAVVDGTNAGFVTVAPSVDPDGSATVTVDNYSRVGKFTSPANATTITEIGWYCQNATEAANFEVGVYDDSSGTAYWLLGASRTNAKGTGSGWKKATGLTIPINGSTVYWLSVQLDNTASATNLDYSVNASYTMDRSGLGILTMPFNWVSAFKSSDILAIYAVYNTTGTAAATITPVVPTTNATFSITSATHMVRLPAQKSTFYAAGRYWAFYGDDTAGADYNLDYITSTDLSSWASPITVAAFPAADACWDVRFDGTYVYYIRSLSEAPTILDGLGYRRGTPNTDGTISWSAVEQEALALPADASDPNFNIDSNGYPYISYDDLSRSRIIKSSTNDGTWSTASGYPVTLETTRKQTLVLPLTDGKMYVIVTEYNADTKAYGYYWDGASWNTETNITDNTVGFSSSPYVPRIGATAIDGKVYLVYHSTSGVIYFKIRSSGGVWGTEEEVESFYLEADSSPLVISNGNDCYVLWQLDPSGIYYTRRLPTGTWERTQRIIVLGDLGPYPQLQASGIWNGGISFQYYDDDVNDIIYGFAEVPESEIVPPTTTVLRRRRL